MFERTFQMNSKLIVIASMVVAFVIPGLAEELANNSQKSMATEKQISGDSVQPASVGTFKGHSEDAPQETVMDSNKDQSENRQKDILSAFESLGGNKPLLDQAKALEPQVSYTVVQKRFVDRNKTFELATEFGNTFGGDSYNRTQSLGLNLHYHFTPRWSVGVKYQKDFNKLTDEGEVALNEALADYNANPTNPSKAYPLVDYPKSETMAFVNWYPIYGKINVLDQGVLHFDLYLLGGYGQIELKSGTSTAMTYGTGAGFWWTQNFTTRLEMRQQNYKNKFTSGERSQNITVGSVQLGWLM